MIIVFFSIESQYPSIFESLNLSGLRPPKRPSAREGGLVRLACPPNPPIGGEGGNSRPPSSGGLHYQLLNHFPILLKYSLPCPDFKNLSLLFASRAVGNDSW